MAKSLFSSVTSAVGGAAKAATTNNANTIRNFILVGVAWVWF